MPPKSTTTTTQKSAPPSSRRSARLAGSKAPESATVAVEAGSKKRSTATDKDKESEPNKKIKTTSKKQGNGTTGPASKEGKTEEEDKEKKASEEKKEEAPASAKPTKPSSSKTLQLGDKLPKLKLENEDGEQVDVSTLSGVVIFLYPKADTPGCTSQACGFRDHFTAINELGYEIYGLSKDKAPAQKKWKTKKELNFHLLSDPESKLIKRLGAFVQPNNTKRSHFIFEKETGKLVDIKLGVKPADDPKNCLDFIKKHHA